MELPAAQDVSTGGSVGSDLPCVGQLTGLQGAPAEINGDQTADGWYYQEPTSKQPAGPWTVEQLRTRWRRNTIDGFTLVWHQRLLAGWTPLADVPELKNDLRTEEGEQDGEEDRGDSGVTKPRRRPLDDMPLTHTFTSEQGELYVYDDIDEDWKLSDVYEELVREQEVADAASGAVEGVAPGTVPSGTAATAAERAAEQEQEEAFQELMATAAAARSSGPVGPPGPGARRTGLAAIAPLGRGGGPGSGGVADGAAAGGAAAGGGGGADAAEGGAGADPEKDAKRQKRREYRERKRLKKQAGVFVRAQENPNVYVSGLPPDVTLQELEPVFKRAGVLKLDPDTGAPKIRIYTAADGQQCKGDALVTYAHAASVELAVKFLHEFALRPKCNICVQQADFEEHDRDLHLSKNELKEMAASRKEAGKERVKYIAAKTAQKEAVSWGGDMDDGTGRRIVLLKHLFSAQEAEREGSAFYTELVDEVRGECQKIGQVVKVTPLERHKLGIVCVKFKTSCEAEECIRVMDGRYFAGRTIEASFYDGRTDLRALGGQPQAQELLAPGPTRPTPVAPAPGAGALAASPTAALPTSPPAGVAQADAPSEPPVRRAPPAAEASDAPLGEPAPSDPPGPAPGPAAPAPGAAAAPSAASAASAPTSGGGAWEDWLNDQSSSDEELQVRTEA